MVMERIRTMLVVRLRLRLRLSKREMGIYVYIHPHFFFVTRMFTLIVVSVAQCMYGIDMKPSALYMY